jgi:Tol biopolymer transport system component
MEPAEAGAASRIVYARGGRLHFVTPGGTPLGRTRKAGYAVVDIAASNNGRRVAVLKRTGADGSRGSYYRAYVRSAGERKLQQIAIGGPLKRAGAPSLALSPHGRLLAVSIGERIRLVDLLTKRRWFLHSPGYGFDVQPSFTADGRHLVFCHGRYPSPFRVNVYEITLGKQRTRRLTHSRADEYFPQLSPDGSHLAFLRRQGDGFDLMTARADGSGERLVRHVGRLISRPDFSPSGRRLAFALVKGYERAQYPSWTLLTTRLDGRGARVVRRGIRGGPLLPQWTRSP